MRILVVEDEPRLLRNLARALREEGYAVDTADAGDDGLFKAENYDYAAVILDVMLLDSTAGATRVDGKGVEVSVADNGPGIAPEDSPHIFKRFYRADKSCGRANGNSGLGLAICKAIVDARGGTISVASETGKGTSFVVRLPA